MLNYEQLCKNCDIYTLHSGVSLSDQRGVFSKSYNKRKIILSTNVAETSLTIDEVAFVIDSGLMKINGYSSSLCVFLFYIRLILYLLNLYRKQMLLKDKVVQVELNQVFVIIYIHKNNLMKCLIFLFQKLKEFR